MTEHRFAPLVTCTRARVWLTLLACFTLGSLPARADLVEGTDYQTLQPSQPGGAPGKIEVVEFFSYACSHCFDMHPKISKWAAGLPANASFVRVPISLGRREWGVLVRTFYALDSMGELQRLDTPIFEAIHRNRVRLFDEGAVTHWLAEQGVPAGKFSAAFNSPQTTEKALRAEQMSYDYKVSGTPFVVVGGKYAALGRTHDQTLSIARQLIDKVVREEQASSSP
jgi:thiol:disulfide interchange protein DsbA